MANVLQKKDMSQVAGISCQNIECCGWYDASLVDMTLAELTAKLTEANAKVAKSDITIQRKDILIDLLRGQRNAAWQREDELKKQKTQLKELAYANLYGTQIICNKYLPAGTIAYALDRDVFYVTGLRWQELTDAERELKAERESNEEKRTMMRQMNRTIIDQTNTIKALRSTISKIAALSESAEKPATGAESSGSSR